MNKTQIIELLETTHKAEVSQNEDMYDATELENEHKYADDIGFSVGFEEGIKYALEQVKEKRYDVFYCGLIRNDKPLTQFFAERLVNACGENEMPGDFEIMETKE